MGLFGITVPDGVRRAGSRPGLVRPGLRGDRPGLDGHRRHPRQPLAVVPDDRHARHGRPEEARTCPSWPPAPGGPAIGTDRARRRAPTCRASGPPPAATGDHYVVNGTKMWITNARYADPLPVPGEDRSTARRRRTRHERTARRRGHARLHSDQRTSRSSATRAPSPARSCWTTCGCRSRTVCSAASKGSGLQQVLSALEWGRVNIAARSVGIAQRAYDEALAYARQRKAFGRPIAEFQADPAASSPRWRRSSRPRG